MFMLCQSFPKKRKSKKRTYFFNLLFILFSENRLYNAFGLDGKIRILESENRFNVNSTP